MKKYIKSLVLTAMLIIAMTFAFALSAGADDVLNGEFASTEGTLNWAYLENGGTLEATGNTYEKNTLVIYGSGTSYTYSKSSIGSAADATSAFPWGDYRESIKHIVIEAPNLTSFKSFSYIANLETIVMPASINTLSDGYHALSHCRYLRSVTITGEDYSSYGEDANIIDLRYISKIRSNSLRYVAEYIDSTKLTLLLGENTTLEVTGTIYFFNGHGGTIDTYVYEGSKGETMLDKFTASSGAASVNKIYYPEPIDPSTLNKALVFEGYQVRTRVLPSKNDSSVDAVNGLRTLYYCDNTVTNKGFTLVEYGTIFATKANAEYAVLEDDLTVAHEKVVKAAIYKNGGIVGTIMKASDANTTKFATTLINIPKDNYSSEICVRGYEVWSDESGNNYVVYSDSCYSDGTNYYPSLCDVTINCFAAGICNSADQDENGILWKILDTCRAELAKDESFADPSSGTRIFVLEDNVIKVSADSTDNDFKENNTEIHVFETLAGETVAIVKATGTVYRIAEMLNTFGVKADTIVYDQGIEKFGFADFKNYAHVKYVVYADSVKTTGTQIFNGASGLVSVHKVDTKRVDGIIDLSHLEGIGFGSDSKLFYGAKANIEGIHLPALQGLQKAISLANDFKKLTTLKAVWCGDNEKLEGTANFEGTNITGSESAFSDCTSITAYVWGEAPVTE